MTTAEIHGELAAARREIIALREELRTELRAPRHEIVALAQRVTALDERLASEHLRTLHALRIVRDDDARAWQRLWDLRRSTEYESAYSSPEPLVTIIITTYSNWRLLQERALPSVLAQTYENWECVVVGDCAPPEAAEAVASFGDPRMRFVNLPYRGPYPPERADAWLISGTTAFNTGMAVMRGDWIGSVGDDDALVPTYVERLLELARSDRAEVAYGQLRMRFPDRPDEVVGTFPPTHGVWGTQVSLFHGCLRFLPLHTSDWVFGVPNDWSWAERMLRIGVRFAMVQEPMVDYYSSWAWLERPAIE